MAGLKEVRTRISSVESTKQITSAMKMVSASKLRKAQNAIIKLRPYEAKMKELMSHILAKADELPQLDYAKKRIIKNVLIIVVVSNKGLCGNYNSIVIKNTKKLIEEEYSGFNVHLITIGKKATEYFTKRAYSVVASYDDIYQNLSFAAAENIAEKLMTQFKEGVYDVIEITYNRFKNAATQILCSEIFLPVAIDKEKDSSEDKSDIDYLYEPEKSLIIAQMVPKIIKLRFYRALLDAHASEHGARMTAMHKATDNATELIKDLRLYYNKVRQATITKEIMEIVSGAEALKS